MTATAADYMARDIVVLRPSMSVHDAMRRLLDHDITGAPVVDALGNVAGILTERDVIGAVFRASYHKDAGGRVEDYMTREVQTIDAGMEIMAVVEVFLNSRYRRFPVLDGTRLVGLLSRRDVLRAIEALW